ncbi:hypothetical protein ABJI51_42695 [Amycolatopsis sp. NEAU-NG30]|uniref:Uncharacterized protein n=1 Tax=Amycolatopsis melonis TaxID=3156488 RepID=A0ABV0LU49_9PSEU
MPMPTGELAAALPAGTAGHVLCSAVPEETWRGVLGGPVLREVAVTSCHVVTADLDVTAGTYDRVPFGGVEPAEVTVAGHRGTVTKSPAKPAMDAMLTVPLAATSERWAAPTLWIRVANQLGVRTERDFRGMAEALGTAMTAAITSPGPSLPTEEEKRHPAELTPIAGTGIADAPYPLIMRQLCTQLARALGRPLDETEPEWPGTCRHKRDGVEVKLSYSARSPAKHFGDRIAGRPADVSEPGGAAEVRLVDGSDQTLVIQLNDFDRSTPGVRAFAEKVVPPLLGR